MEMSLSFERQIKNSQIFNLVMMHDGFFAASHLVFGHTAVHRVCVGEVVRESNLVSLIS